MKLKKNKRCQFLPLHFQRRSALQLLRHQRPRGVLLRPGERRARGDPPDADAVEVRAEGLRHRQRGGGRHGRVALACECSSFLDFSLEGEIRISSCFGMHVSDGGENIGWQTIIADRRQVISFKLYR